MPQSPQVLIAPSLMAANMLNLQAEVTAIQHAGADWLHLDIMDGHFVPNLTFGPDTVRQLRPLCSLPFDVHLMVEPLELFIDLFHKAGADHITIHGEVSQKLAHHLKMIRDLGCKSGIAINPGTAVETIVDFLSDTDQVLVMSVNPGFYGQAFMPIALEKIADLAAIKKQHDLAFTIVADGGICPQNAPQVIEAGANALVAGNSVFKQPDYAAAIKALRI